MILPIELKIKLNSLQTIGLNKSGCWHLDCIFKTAFHTLDSCTAFEFFSIPAEQTIGYLANKWGFAK